MNQLASVIILTELVFKISTDDYHFLSFHSVLFDIKVVKQQI